MAKKSTATPTPAKAVKEDVTEATETETPAVEETPVETPVPTPEPEVVETQETPDTPVVDIPTVVRKKNKTIVT